MASFAEGAGRYNEFGNEDISLTYGAAHAVTRALEEARSYTSSYGFGNLAEQSQGALSLLQASLDEVLQRSDIDEEALKVELEKIGQDYEVNAGRSGSAIMQGYEAALDVLANDPMERDSAEEAASEAIGAAVGTPETLQQWKGQKGK